MSEQRPTSTRQARAGLEYALSTTAKPNPLVLAWRCPRVGGCPRTCGQYLWAEVVESEQGRS